MMADVTFGIALDYPERWEQTPPEWPEGPLDGIDVLEIPGGALPLPPVWQEAVRTWKCDLMVRDLMPGWFIRQAAAESGAIFGEFKERFRERLRQAAREEIATVTADFDLAGAGRDAATAAQLTRMLPAFYQPLEEFGLTLLLPLRLPAAAGEVIWQTLQAWNRLHYPRLGLAVDLFPHETTGREAELTALLEQCKYSIRTLRFHYEPELGNHLVAKSMLDYIAPFLRRGLPITVTAAPICIQQTALTAERSALQKLFAELRGLIGETNSTESKG